MPYTATNGIDIWYEITGSGPLVVLIHGHSADLRMWDLQVDALEQAGYRVLRYDVRGHGRSSVCPGGYTWDSYSADLAALLDHIGPEEPAHIVGASMGGAIALKFTLDTPGRVASLSLIDSALPGFSYSEEFSGSIEALVEAVRREGAGAAFERVWLNHAFFDGVRRHPERFGQLREMVRSYTAPEYQADYGGEPGYEQPDLACRLEAIAQPALVVAGENDVPDFLLIAEILARTIPNAEQVLIPDCWHLPNMEKPEILNPLLVDFLDRASRQTRAPGNAAKGG